MAVDHIRYDLLAQEALRGVVRHVLADAARNGLPGDHHFYISFDTGAEGVRISSRLREQYPEEITIILQHQFWDLSVTEEGFEVGKHPAVPDRHQTRQAATIGSLQKHDRIWSIGRRSPLSMAGATDALPEGLAIVTGLSG